MGRFPLGNDRFAVVVKFMDEIGLHIRQYQKSESGRYFPTKIGTFLRPMRFANLDCNLSNISEAVNKLRDGLDDINLKLHVGGGVYCTVKSGIFCVDIRKYFVPENSESGDAIPTKMGIALKFVEFEALLACVEDIKKLSSELRDTQPCYIQWDHSNLTAYLECKECSPFEKKIPE